MSEYEIVGQPVTQLLEAQICKLEGREFDSRRCYGIFH